MTKGGKSKVVWRTIKMGWTTQLGRSVGTNVQRKDLNSRWELLPSPFLLVYGIGVKPCLSLKSSLLKMAKILGLFKQKRKREIELRKNKQTTQIFWPSGFAHLMGLSSLAPEVKRQYDEGCSFSTCPRGWHTLSKEENIFSSRRFRGKTEWVSLSRPSEW